MNIDEIKEQYINKQRSLADIAKDFNTYPNFIRRMLIKAGISLRTKKESQTLALQTGRAKHPTKGKKRSEAVKQQIAQKVFDNWKKMPDDERQRRANIAKDNWNNLTADEKAEFQKLSNQAVRQSSKEGSKLERFVYQELLKRNYKVEFHKQGLIQNTKLEIDMYLPEYLSAIEIDGPSHFLPIWGQDSLIKNMKSDQEKNGLILNAGFIIIRVKQLTKTISNIIMRHTLEKILAKLQEIQHQFPEKDQRFIEIEA